MSKIFISYYGVAFFSSTGADEIDTSANSIEDAVKIARKRLKNSRFNSHAVITQFGILKATVINSRGRITTKKAK